MTKTTKDTTELVSIQEKLKADLAVLKDRVDPPSGFTISTKGKQFSFPDGSISQGPINAVVLDWVSSYAWFKGIYNAKDPQPPMCFAVGRIPAEMKPSEAAPERQSEECNGCPKNEWGSAVNGGKGKDCKNKRRILVAPADADPSFQPWILEVSPTGIKHFDKFVAAVADVGKHPLSIITEISFDQNEAYPSLRFKAMDVHGEEEKFWAIREAGQSILLQEPQIERKENHE